ncbi:MAG TPA: Rne/Rng family ribonuclease, partial [Acidimicrobiales bacterium]|nr:Rne/Rng family ribonuclease [Acidimicrobiales bacterium]
MSEATTGQPVETPAETPGPSTAPIENDAVGATEASDSTRAPVTGSGDGVPPAPADGDGEGSSPSGPPRTGPNRRRRGSRGGRGRGRSGTGANAGGAGAGGAGAGSATRASGDEGGAVTPVTAGAPQPTHDGATVAPVDRVQGAVGPPTPAPGAPLSRPKIGDTRPGSPVVTPDPAPRSAGGSRAGNGRRTVNKAGGRDLARQPAEPGTELAETKQAPAPRSPQVQRSADNGQGSGDGARASSRRGGRERRGKAVGRYMIAVHVQPHLTQIALLEGRTLVEHYVSRATDDDIQIDGNIYRGRVQNVLPGMEAAFIDIGTPKNAVLYRGDVRYDTDDVETGASGQPRIEEVLRPGQTILCQVTKNPIGAKGARLTQEVSLPGRFVVLVPNSTAYGISKRLDDGERKRLRKIVDAVRPKGHGLIVRTAAAGASAEELSNDVERLMAEWEGIAADAIKGTGAALLYQEPDIAVRVIREELNREYRGVVIDDLVLYEQVRDYVGAVNPELADRVEYYDPAEEPLPIFDRFHVHEQLHKALDRKVFLPSGGSLVIDRTEALTVIDVNTGKNVGKSNLEETVYRNNLEAAEEVARQLRLRDIGGIIVIDFIDMEIRDNRDKVSSALRSALARDKTRTQVFDISELG